MTPERLAQIRSLASDIRSAVPEMLAELEIAEIRQASATADLERARATTAADMRSIAELRLALSSLAAMAIEVCDQVGIASPDLELVERAKHEAVRYLLAGEIRTGR